MAKSLYQLKWEVLGRLNDTNLTIWSEAEIESYIKSGYELLCLTSLCLWKQDYLYDVAGTATYDLPDDFYQMDRVTNNYRRLVLAYSNEMQVNDSRYHTTQGTVEAYILDKDGVGKIRLWRVPATSAQSAAIAATGTWGLPRTVTSITTDTPTGTWGTARMIILGEAVTGTWGIVRKATTLDMTLNTTIEYFHRPSAMTISDYFEIPDHYTKYVRHYAMHRAFDREGAGQEETLSKHYFDRFTTGIELMKRRAASINNQRISQMGGSESLSPRPPRPRLPWNYGRMTTR